MAIVQCTASQTVLSLSGLQSRNAFTHISAQLIRVLLFTLRVKTNTLFTCPLLRFLSQQICTRSQHSGESCSKQPALLLHYCSTPQYPIFTKYGYHVLHLGLYKELGFHYYIKLYFYVCFLHL